MRMTEQQEKIDADWFYVQGWQVPQTACQLGQRGSQVVTVKFANARVYHDS